MSAFALRNISKSYGSSHVLDDVTIEAEEGEFIALVGPSGCGKTTLLRIAAGLDHGDSGSVSMGDRDITAEHPADRNVAMVFQSYALYPHLTTAQNIAVPLAMRTMSKLERMPLIGRFVAGRAAHQAAIRQQVVTTAASLKIDHLLDRKPGQMSGGQRQRVALARALVRQPGVFLMDEPLSNLDANLRVHTRAEIVDLHRRAGVPTLYVTHDQAEALSMADRVAVMMGGRLLQFDEPARIYDDPRHIEVAQFVGSPRINVLDALTSENGTVVFGGKVLAEGITGPVGTPVQIAVRPERIKLRDATGHGIPAIVLRLEFLGSEVLVFTRLVGTDNGITVKAAPADVTHIASGARVCLEIDAGACLVFGSDGLRVLLRAPLKMAVHA
ncbi:ABC transporter ATP-binding protein [Phyllobacterium zundukense]|uniref:Glycerol-3-phosphate ABC transporter ATP-binding protein n=1 Tax=Phyllobacterium zundukense TaxID=1867719 RepID=A0A2N9VTP3_9HYPH|nr:ABC transporter ATP-binding protein [Phyllobacterium zundukense]ATU93190.1 glycerol-3-phosphate ABC transporter ATP-binding protein [Phyllobacterium zundukense]PIO42861.1 glycerol-3-phosphate ABC transporter ATP-binding protein [Phyllobacterium zundukense]